MIKRDDKKYYDLLLGVILCALFLYTILVSLTESDRENLQESIGVKGFDRAVFISEGAIIQACTTHKRLILKDSTIIQCEVR